MLYFRCNKMRDLDLSIIIVNYNTFKLTKETIDSCLAEPTHYTYEIFLVDNKSTDDSLAKLEDYFKDEISRGIIKLIANSNNDGFAKANNLAIEQAKGEYILLLNSDTLIKEATIDKCMDYMTKGTNADVGALGCKVSLADGSLDKACKRSFPNPANAFYKLFNVKTNSGKDDYNLDDLDDDGVYEIDCLVGAFMLVRRTTITDGESFTLVKLKSFTTKGQAVKIKRQKREIQSLYMNYIGQCMSFIGNITLKSTTSL